MDWARVGWSSATRIRMCLCGEYDGPAQGGARPPVLPLPRGSGWRLRRRAADRLVEVFHTLRLLHRRRGAVEQGGVHPAGGVPPGQRLERQDAVVATRFVEAAAGEGRLELAGVAPVVARADHREQLAVSGTVVGAL